MLWGWYTSREKQANSAQSAPLSTENYVFCGCDRKLWEPGNSGAATVTNLAAGADFKRLWLDACIFQLFDRSKCCCNPWIFLSDSDGEHLWVKPSECLKSGSAQDNADDRWNALNSVTFVCVPGSAKWINVSLCLRELSHAAETKIFSLNNLDKILSSRCGVWYGE